MLLKDKVVAISGIGPGLGVKLAVEAARQGACGVITSARSMAKLDDAEKTLRDLGLDVPILKVATDIRDRAQCDALVERAQERFGRIDALINSAFIHGAAEMPSTSTMDNVREAIETNLVGTLTMTQAVIPIMSAQGGGAIVMVSTMAARKVLRATDMIYAMSKAPLESAVRHLAYELGPLGIRVNMTFQGFMWGQVVESYVERVATQTGRPSSDVKAEIAGRTALGRIVTDDECASAILFLASDYSSAITGAQLDVNGGEWMP